MKLLTGKARPVQLQWLIWAFVLAILFFTYLPEYNWKRSVIYTIINASFYAIIIYGNIYFLLPRLYEKRHIIAYALSSLLFLAAAGVSRSLLGMYLYNHYFSTKPEPITIRMLVYTSLAGLLIYLLSFIFRIAIAYFTLRQKADEMAAQKSQAELNVLKSQVQPHFLFNTLNNIYYEAYREAPRTAALIERLSEIMRYFVDESPREAVSLATEVQFLENYIALEKIRVRYALDLVFEKHYLPESQVPPMLLMPFVENIFKHGVDKSSRENRITLILQQQEGYLLFRTENRLHAPAASPGRGSGIGNLHRRLSLLFGTNFELNTQPSGPFFTAFLKIPCR